MGYLLVIPGAGDDRTLEFDTISCPHCQQTAAITLKGHTKSVKFNHWCGRCHKAICRSCASIMEKIGHCPGPFVARVEAQMKSGRSLDDFDYGYRSVQRV